MTQIELVEKQESKKKSVSSGYISELREEIKKITWTKKDELIKSTKAVLYVTVFAGLGIYCVDLGLRAVMSGLHHLVQIISH